MNDSEVSKLCKGSLSSAKNFEINVIVFSIYMIVSSSMMLSLPYIRNSGFFILVVCFIFLVLLCLIFNYLTISFIGDYMDKSDNKRSL